MLVQILNAYLKQARKQVPIRQKSYAQYMTNRQPGGIAAASGAIAGLVAITPAAGFVTPIAALIIGAIASVVCFFVTHQIVRKRVDDALDVFGVHGVGGLIGAVLTGVFATTSVNPDGVNGLLYGNPALLYKQIIAAAVVLGYSAVVTYGILKLVEKTIGLRVSKEQEEGGLDVALHGERAYS